MSKDPILERIRKRPTIKRREQNKIKPGPEIQEFLKQVQRESKKIEERFND